MYVVGTGRLGSSQVGTYKLTDYPGVTEALRDLKYSDEYYHGIGLSETVKKIEKKQKICEPPIDGLFCFKYYFIVELYKCCLS